jgi:hypothetical protein
MKEQNIYIIFNGYTNNCKALSKLVNNGKDYNCNIVESNCYFYSLNNLLDIETLFGTAMIDKSLNM